MPSKPNVERDQDIIARYKANESPEAIMAALGISSKSTVYNALKRNGIARKRAMHSLTTEQEDEVVRRYTVGGENALAISQDFDVHVQTIHNTLRKHGVATRPELSRPRIHDATKPLIVEACTMGGKTLQEAADEHGVSKESAFGIMRRHRAGGGEGMPRGRRPWRTLNHAAFDVLTPECLYWLGFIFADGCVCRADPKRSAIFAIGLAEKDRGHLEKLRAFLGSDHKIVWQPPKPSELVSGSGPSVNYHVHSDHLCDTLNSYGVVTKRTLAPIPALAASRDFWRGAVDGDGWLGTMPGIYPYVGLSGQRPLLETFREFLAKNDLPALNVIPTVKGECFRVGTSADTAGAIIKTLYEDATVALDRKDARAKSIISGNLVRFPPYVEGPSAITLDEDRLSKLSDEDEDEKTEQEPSDLD